MRLLPTVGAMLLASASVVCGGDPRGAQTRTPPPQPRDASAAPSPTAVTADSDSLLGRAMPQWQVAAWANTQPLTLADLRGSVVVVRFWTNTCPYCEASMPALVALASQFADRPVVFVGLYHAKPRDRPGAWQDAQKIARDWGVTFALGHDKDWATLRSWWLSTGDRAATSATIVLGTQGEVIHVHPGPVYFPSDDPKHAEENRAFVALRDAVSRGLPNSD